MKKLQLKELTAPTKKYRAVFIDCFDGDDCIMGDFKTRLGAIRACKKIEGVMAKCYTYNDKGACVYSGGSF